MTKLLYYKSKTILPSTSRYKNHVTLDYSSGVPDPSLERGAGGDELAGGGHRNWLVT